MWFRQDVGYDHGKIMPEDLNLLLLWRGRSLSTPGSNHLPSFFESFIYLSLGERSDAAGDVVGLARRQNRLTGLFHFG